MTRKKAWIPSAIPFFLIGLAYYQLSPAFVFNFLPDDSDLIFVASKYLDADYFGGAYFVDTIVILTSFLSGYLVPRFRPARSGSVLDYGSFQASSSRLIAILFLCMILFFSALALSSGGGFFTGYQSYNILVLGPFSTSAFLSVWLLNYFSNRQIKRMFFIFFGICAALLLGWGSRMFFVLSFTALLLGLVSRNRGLLTSARFYVVIITVFCLMAVIGILRQGGREFSVDGLLAILFAEPLFTAISGSLYLENSGGRQIFGIPNDLMASVIHFIPSAIFPGKIELIAEMTANEDVVSPLGGKALLVSLYSNFGFFYPLFVGLVGAYYRLLYHKAQSSIFFRAVYFSALPVLCFLFFRENLITVIKVLLFNGFVVPMLIAMALIWLSPRSFAEIRATLKNRQSNESRTWETV